jgi:hypothetical protein
MVTRTPVVPLEANRAVGPWWLVAVARRLVLVLIVAWLPVMMFQAGNRLGMSEALHARHAYYSIPYALSRLYFGVSGYVILRDVADPLIAAYPHVTDRHVARAMEVDPNRARVMYFPADDKGDADFTTMSFVLFGVQIASLYKTWFLLLGVSIAVFVASFWRSDSRLVLLALVLLAAYTALFALPLTTELGTVQNPRVFGVVSIVSVLHLCCLVIDGAPLRVGSAATAIVQAALIALSVHVRSTEIWQVLCVIGVAAVVGRHQPLRSRLVRAWPAWLLALGIAALEGYQVQAFDRVYRSTQIRHRIMWHNIGAGFALNPVLATKYALALDDSPMMRMVRQRLLRTNRAAEVDNVFMPPLSNTNYYGIARDYVRYDRIAREVVVSLVLHNKWQAVKTFIVYKPLVLWRQFAWASGYREYSLAALHDDGQASAIASNETRRALGLYLDPLRPEILAVWVCLAIIAAGPFAQGQGRRRAALSSGDVALACWIAAASVIPNMVAYPIISAIGVALVTVMFVAFTVAAWLVAKGAERVSWASFA